MWVINTTDDSSYIQRWRSWAWELLLEQICAEPGVGVQLHTSVVAAVAAETNRLVQELLWEKVKAALAPFNTADS